MGSMCITSLPMDRSQSRFAGDTSLHGCIRDTPSSWRKALVECRWLVFHQPWEMQGAAGVMVIWGCAQPFARVLLSEGFLEGCSVVDCSWCVGPGLVGPRDDISAKWLL